RDALGHRLLGEPCRLPLLPEHLPDVHDAASFRDSQSRPGRCSSPSEAIDSDVRGGESKRSSSCAGVMPSGGANRQSMSMDGRRFSASMSLTIETETPACLARPDWVRPRSTLASRMDAPYSRNIATALTTFRCHFTLLAYPNQVPLEA